MSEYPPPPQDYSQQQVGYPSEPAYPPQYPPAEQQGYPPQQPVGYPPQQPGYPPQQPTGYPPQQPGYPPQQPAGYPLQQPGYPPAAQPGYPPTAQPPPQQQGYTQPGPPPYYAPEPQPVVQQQTKTDVIVVTQQPTTQVTTIRTSVGDHYLTLSIILTIMCFFCGWWSLLCTIPAIFFAVSAREAEGRGDPVAAHSNGRIALILDIVAVGIWVAGIIIVIIASAVG